MFGATASAPAATNTFSFGGSASASKPGGLFGAQPAAQAPSTGFTFGAANTAQPAQGSGGLFGQSTGQPQQQQQQGGGLFGQAAGQQQQGGGGLFGQQQQQQQQPQQGGGMFGQSTQPQAGQQQGSLFVQPAQGQQGASLFGQPAQQQGASLFGQPAQQQGQGQTGGLFNASTNQPTTSFGLGSTNNASTSLFGSTTQPNQTASTSLFGAKPAQSFGAQSTNTTQPGQAGGMFGSTNQSLFGQPQQNPAFGNASTNQPHTSMTQSLIRQEVSIESRISAIRSAWDTGSPDCRFKYFFYNVVEPETTQRYGRPNGISDEKWFKAMRENPDPSTMVPSLAVGFPDIKKRVTGQEQMAEAHHRKTKEITQTLDQISRQSTMRAALRLVALQNDLAQLQKRLIGIMTKTPAFIPPLQTAAARGKEAETRAVLENVKSAMDGKRGKAASKGYGVNQGATPKTSQRMMGQVNELWGAIEELKRKRTYRVGEQDGWVGDEKVLREIAQILQQQQLALHKLTELVNNTSFDAEVMMKGLGLGER